MPFGLDHPFWVEDPDFDLDFHVRHTAVAPPGSDEQIAELVARIVGRPLDRRRPLWETYVIEGLPDERFGILTKVHHATIDGAVGRRAARPDARRSIPTATRSTRRTGDWRPEREPTDSEVLLRAGASLIRKPGRAVVLATRTVRELGTVHPQPRDGRAPPTRCATASAGRSGAVLNIGRTRSPEGESIGARCPAVPRRGRRSTPRSPPHRRFAYRSTSLESVKGIKNALGATVNDVVMAACAGGLRTWLEAHDALPDKPLIAGIPVSIRTGDEPEKWTNRVSTDRRVTPHRRARSVASCGPRARCDGRRQGPVRRGAR